MYRYREENFLGKNTFHCMTNMAKPSTRILALEIMNLQFLVSILTLQMLHQGVIRYNTDITSLLICEFNFVKWSEQISVLVHILHFYDLPIYVIDQSYIVKVLVKKKRKDLLDLHVTPSLRLEKLQVPSIFVCLMLWLCQSMIGN